MTADITVLTTKEYSHFDSCPEPNGIIGGLKPRPRTKEEMPGGEAAEHEIDVAARLGLHNSNKPKTGDYVGLVWWPEKEGKTALRVTPKFEQMDYLQMYLECLQDKVVAPHMDKCFFFWPEKKLIEIKKKDIPLGEAAAPFAALAFVRELHDMVKRNMRKNFIRKEENLTGRFKGRLLMSQHVRKNLLNGRPDRNYCQFGVISEDCRENQILLAALDRATRKLFADSRMTENTTIQQQIRTCRSALQGVTLRRRIHNRDFTGIRYTGTFVHYKRPHALAKLILNSQELDPSIKADEKNDDFVKVVPFALCTSELFERYTEVKLKSVFKDRTLRAERKGSIWGTIPAKRVVGEGGKELYRHEDSKKEISINCRPDFLVPFAGLVGREAWILDSKYKRPGKKDDIEQHDIRQVALYVAHLGILKKLECIKKNKEGKTIEYYFTPEASLHGGLIYPEVVTTKEKLRKALDKFEQQFQNSEMNKCLFSFQEYHLPCPSVG